MATFYIPLVSYEYWRPYFSLRMDSYVSLTTFETAEHRNNGTTVKRRRRSRWIKSMQDRRLVDRTASDLFRLLWRPLGVGVAKRNIASTAHSPLGFPPCVNDGATHAANACSHLLPFCHEGMDAYGDHLVCCDRVEFSTRHSVVVQCITRFLRTAGL